MATKEQVGQLRSDVAAQAQAYGQLKQSDSVYHHLYHCPLLPKAVRRLCDWYACSYFHSYSKLYSLYMYTTSIKTHLLIHVEPAPLQARSVFPMTQGAFTPHRRVPTLQVCPYFV